MVGKSDQALYDDGLGGSGDGDDLLGVSGGNKGIQDDTTTPSQGEPYTSTTGTTGGDYSGGMVPENSPPWDSGQTFHKRDVIRRDQGNEDTLA